MGSNFDSVSQARMRAEKEGKRIVLQQERGRTPSHKSAQHERSLQAAAEPICGNAVQGTTEGRAEMVPLASREEISASFIPQTED